MLARRLQRWSLARVASSGQRALATFEQYLQTVQDSRMKRPRDITPVDTETAAPFLWSVDNMASHLRLATTDRRDGSAAASLLEATWPLAHDEQLRHSVSDLGPYSTFRMSKFYEAVDALTADVAYRHTDGVARGLALVTAAHSHSRKLTHTEICCDMTLRCYVTRTGSASLEVRTDAIQMREGSEVLVNTCATTMVALDAATMRPAKGAVPELARPPADDEDRQRFALRAKLAEGHAALRASDASQSMQLRAASSQPPSPSEMAAVHALHREAVRATLEVIPRKIRTVEESTYRSSFICFPEQRNVHGKLFGGFVVGQAFNIATYAAKFFARGTPVVALGLDVAEFHQPVTIGDAVTFTARVVHCTPFTCRVHVTVEVRDPRQSHRAPTRSNRLMLVFALNSPPGGVVPITYGEILMHVDAARLHTTSGPDEEHAKAILTRDATQSSQSDQP